ncbi:hypothetical protein OS493_030503 [Desmophyllum pertusum]|uniref:Uncharacterized protein n=1 Tax=Desmophyllum pertusum TaxID=174260 RepID=A0A9W9YMT2_9CNID|nr:hypothetical protein OS493_030503 [Desmophyllum pertusum]
MVKKTARETSDTDEASDEKAYQMTSRCSLEMPSCGDEENSSSNDMTMADMRVAMATSLEESVL